MPVNSKRKGGVMERKACAWLAELGFPGFARTAQHKGKTGDAPDIESAESLTRLHIEVKSSKDIRIGTVALVSAIEQAERDAKPSGRQPVVAWWEHQRGWRATARLDGIIITVADNASAWRFLDGLNNRAY